MRDGKEKGRFVLGGVVKMTTFRRNCPNKEELNIVCDGFYRTASNTVCWRHMKHRHR